MRCITSVAKGLDVSAVQAELAGDVWNKNTLRTAHKGSPHRETSDIWVRYCALDDPQFTKVNEQHESVWYDGFQSVRSLVDEVMTMVSGEKLGGVLITKIPAGKQVYPHIDHGWHAREYEKFAVSIHANLDQTFCFEDESLVTETGELFWFDNAHGHWVLNPSDEDRVTCIICIKRNTAFQTEERTP